MNPIQKLRAASRGKKLAGKNDVRRRERRLLVALGAACVVTLVGVAYVWGPGALDALGAWWEAAGETTRVVMTILLAVVTVGLAAFYGPVIFGEFARSRADAASDYRALAFLPGNLGYAYATKVADATTQMVRELGRRITHVLAWIPTDCGIKEYTINTEHEDFADLRATPTQPGETSGNAARDMRKSDFDAMRKEVREAANRLGPERIKLLRFMIGVRKLPNKGFTSLTTTEALLDVLPQVDGLRNVRASILEVHVETNLRKTATSAPRQKVHDLLVANP